VVAPRFQELREYGYSIVYGQGFALFRSKVTRPPLLSPAGITWNAEERRGYRLLQTHFVVSTIDVTELIMVAVANSDGYVRMIRRLAKTTDEYPMQLGRRAGHLATCHHSTICVGCRLCYALRTLRTLGRIDPSACAKSGDVAAVSGNARDEVTPCTTLGTITTT